MLSLRLPYFVSRWLVFLSLVYFSSFRHPAQRHPTVQLFSQRCLSLSQFHFKLRVPRQRQLTLSLHKSWAADLRAWKRLAAMQINLCWTECWRCKSLLRSVCWLAGCHAIVPVLSSGFCSRYYTVSSCLLFCRIGWEVSSNPSWSKKIAWSFFTQSSTFCWDETIQKIKPSWLTESERIRTWRTLSYSF